MKAIAITCWLAVGFNVAGFVVAWLNSGPPKSDDVLGVVVVAFVTGVVFGLGVWAWFDRE